MKLSLTLAALAATLTSALPTAVHTCTITIPSPTMPPAAENASSKARVLMGHNGHIFLADYTGAAAKITLKQPYAGAASWMSFTSPNKLYAVDENSAALSLFSLDLAKSTLELKKKANGSEGVVHLAPNKQGTRMVGAAYGAGTIDVWNTENGDLKLMKTIQSAGKLGPNTDRQEKHHPHQAVLDPSDRFYAINDLGSDSIVIVDSKDDKFEVSSFYTLNSPGAGPRHGVFYPRKSNKATHYMVVCEMTNEIHVLAVEYKDDTLAFTPVQTISTFAKGGEKKGAAAGEIILSPDNKDLYVSNRLTGETTDSIAHFKVSQDASSGEVSLKFQGSVSSGGLLPRMMSFSKNASTVFVGNQDGASGFVALKRNADGSLVEKPTATIDNKEFGDKQFGPQFVMQIQ